MSIKQKVITVMSDLSVASEVPAVEKYAELGWFVKQISTTAFEKRNAIDDRKLNHHVAITLLLEKEIQD